ncbi:MAG TPA: very short patch repair endonuclease [Chitinophagaceae bacterium]|nr:very short patch repair endonuclease [Chitinophagaceae bacterium]
MKTIQPKVYLRDGRAPIPKSEAISKVMSANKGKDTTPEMIFRKALWKAGIKGYRLNWKKVPGRPDIAFPGKRTAIFINGCFWHRCPYCNYKLPKTNTSFWENKFSKNIDRDKRKIEDLKKLDWQVFVIWECEVKSSLQTIVDKFKTILS